MAEASTEEYLGNILALIGSRAAQGAAYQSWPDDFARKEVREIWSPDVSREHLSRRVSVSDLQSADWSKLSMLGFRMWDDDLAVIPIWAFNYIADGETLQSIFGEKKSKGVQEIDLDVRGGCIAYGFPRATTPNNS